MCFCAVQALTRIGTAEGSIEFLCVGFFSSLHRTRVRYIWPDGMWYFVSRNVQASSRQLRTQRLLETVRPTSKRKALFSWQMRKCQQKLYCDQLWMRMIEPCALEAVKRSLVVNRRLEWKPLRCMSLWETRVDAQEASSFDLRS